MEGKEIHNHFEKDSNCQVFNGPVSGCVFAMPGSVVNQHPNTPNQEPTGEGAEKNVAASNGMVIEEHVKAAEPEELCHFIYPGLADPEAQTIHRQISDLVVRFGVKDICAFLKDLAEKRKILLPQTPQNAFSELHRMGMPPEDTKGFGYDNFCKYYR